MTPAVIIHCPELGRDIGELQARVPHAVVVRGPRTRHGHDGCIQAHRAVVKRAIRSGWRSVFVMEDDCQFTEAFSLDQWEADAAWAAAHGFNVLAGGCVSTRNPRRVRDGLFAVERFKSTHCVVYHAPVYPIILKVTEPIDVMIGTLGARCLVAHPFAAVQRPGYSGIQECAVDYVPMYQRHEQHLAGVA